VRQGLWFALALLALWVIAGVVEYVEKARPV